MDPLPDLEDLRLVAALGRAGSVGGAARELGVSQPSASQRLSRLERRTGVRLFERDTLGARATPAGHEMVRQAEHILGHVAQVYDAVRSAAVGRPLRVGTFPSLAESLFQVLDDLLDVTLDPVVDHGERLVDWVGEGVLDAAFVGIAHALTLPRGTPARRVGEDPLVLLLPPGSRRRTGRQPLRGLQVVYGTYDAGGPALHERLAALGAVPRRGATLATALAIARRRGHPAAVPRSALAGGLRAGERVVVVPGSRPVRMSMITGPRPDRRLLAALPGVAAELGLDGRGTRSRRS